MDVDISKLIFGDTRSEISDDVVGPYNYLEALTSNNQNFRTKFLIAFNDLYFHIPHGFILDKLGEVISIFHNASLLVDDIEDNSTYRRGHPSAHTKFGIPLTLNCGNLMYFVALQKAQTELCDEFIQSHRITDIQTQQHIKFKCSEILTEEMLNLHNGQGLDIYWRDYIHKIKENLPTIENYLEMVMNKTGGLFRLSIKLLMLFSQEKSPDDILAIANLLGIIYQIRDDYLNITDKNYYHNLGLIGDDLFEGKLTLPILHCLSTKENTPVHKIIFSLRETEKENERKEFVPEARAFLMSESGSIGFTKELIKSYGEKAKSMIISNSNTNESKLISIINAITSL